LSVILDAGALVAIERGDPRVWAILRRELAAGRAPVTHGGVIGQVWRGGTGRQARLASALAGIHVRALDDDLGRRAGVLLAGARRTDVIDAALVLLAEAGDEVYTGDADDLGPLVSASGADIDLVEL
jgi:hypothetical protein